MKCFHIHTSIVQLFILSVESNSNWYWITLNSIRSESSVACAHAPHKSGNLNKIYIYPNALYHLLSSFFLPPNSSHRLLSIDYMVCAFVRTHCIHIRIVRNRDEAHLHFTYILTSDSDPNFSSFSIYFKSLLPNFIENPN